MSPVPQAVEVLASRQPVDETTVEDLLRQEAARLGVQVTVRWVPQVAPGDLDPRSSDPLVVLTGPDDPDLAWLPDRRDRVVIRLDLAPREQDRSPGVFRHIRGRGIDGLRWALRVGFHHLRWSADIVAYGPHPEQFGEFRSPATAPPDTGSPLVILLHGGFWRSRWGLDLMDALAIDLAERGLASWNVEYRRPDRHGWPATIADVAGVLAQVPALADRYRLDAGRTVIAGHSAGGQLAVQAAADLAGRAGPIPRLVVSLAGLVDLVQLHRRDLGNGAVPMALGGTPEQVPEVYAAACPMLRLPVPVDQLVVIGAQDGPDLLEMSRRYARAAGPRALLIEDDGDHFSVIDPASGIWRRTAAAIAGAVAG